MLSKNYSIGLILYCFDMPMLSLLTISLEPIKLCKIHLKYFTFGWRAIGVHNVLNDGINKQANSFVCYVVKNENESIWYDYSVAYYCLKKSLWKIHTVIDIIWFLKQFVLNSDYLRFELELIFIVWHSITFVLVSLCGMCVCVCVFCHENKNESI